MKIDPAISNDEIRRALTSGIRMIPPRHLLDQDTRRRIEAQDRILASVVVTICAASGVAIPASIIGAHRSVPPGWWFDAGAMGWTSAFGDVSMIAAGSDGVPISYRDGDGIDHRRQGVDATGWAILALHEACHSAHHLALGLGAAATAMRDPHRAPNQEPRGFATFVHDLHRRLTGSPLPAGYDATRWPLGAPGLLALVDGFAAAVAAYAVQPATEGCPCSEAEWLEAQRMSFSRDLHDDRILREAAAAFRSGQKESVA